MRVDTVIRNGTVVTSSTQSVTDLGLREGRIIQIGGEIEADEEFDATGKLVMPGGIDMHVHLTPVEVDGGMVAWVDNFESGSAAAAAGGITTLGNMTFPRPGEGLGAALARTRELAERQSITDFVLHPVLLDPSPEIVAEIPGLVEAGHSSIKIFMIAGDFDTRGREYLDALQVAGRAGALTLFHCEDGCIIGFLCEQLIAGGGGGPADTPPAVRSTPKPSRPLARSPLRGRPTRRSTSSISRAPKPSTSAATRRPKVSPSTSKPARSTYI
jgi:dihydropyrimidinase